MPAASDHPKSPDNVKNLKLYFEKIYKDLKEQYKSSNEITSRLQDMMKFVRTGQVSLNVDTLIGSKVDPKVFALIVSVTFLIDKIELYANKCNLKDMDKTYATK